MKSSEPGSTGAAEISVFHPCVAGKSGSGPGGLVSSRGAMAASRIPRTAQSARAVPAARAPQIAAAAKMAARVRVNSLYLRIVGIDYGRHTPLQTLSGKPEHSLAGRLSFFDPLDQSRRDCAISMLSCQLAVLKIDRCD